MKAVISLHGPFFVRSSDGQDLTPKSAKAQGLLALLATSPNSSRTRVWLQDKLWSDRAKEQGAASLRQALTEIRKALKNNADLLSADRQRVSLLSDSFIFDQNTAHGEFLEGIDVKDEEFEDWLCIERSHRVATAAIGPPIETRKQITAFVFPRNGDIAEPHTIIADIFSDCISRSLQDALSLQVVRLPSAPPELPLSDQPNIRLEYSVTQICDGKLAVRAEAIDAQSRGQIWAGTEMIVLSKELPEDHIALLSLANQIVESVADYLAQRQILPVDAAGISIGLTTALRHIFSMTQDGFQKGDAILADLDDELSPIVSAWRAHLRAIALVERQAVDAQKFREEGQYFANRAQPRSHANAVALSALANTRLIIDADVTACDELSSQAVRLNSAGPLGWWSRSAAHLYAGHFDRAYEAANRAAQLTGPSPFKFWWDFQRGLTAAMTGRIEEALDQTQRAAINGPRFRPALRYLTALQSLRGDTTSARITAEKLRLIEPDFTPDRLATDPDYPSSLMRRKNIVQRDIGQRLR